MRPHVPAGSGERLPESVPGRNGRGFTLVELVVVIGVAAVLMAIAAPSFEAIVYGSSDRRVTAELIADLQAVRLRAIRTNKPATVVFDVPADADRYTVTWTEMGVERTRVGRLNSPRGRVVIDTNPPQGSAAPVNRLVFTPMGFIHNSSNTTTGNIYLRDTENDRRTNVVTTLAGAFQERRWTGSAWAGAE